jgi:hypothetical protein
LLLSDQFPITGEAMATRTQQFRAKEEQRESAKNQAEARRGRSKPGVAPKDRSRVKKHAARKATYAFEATSAKRPSRKSSRKSANRAKPDSSFNLVEELRKGSPEATFRKAQARSARGRSRVSPASRPPSRGRRPAS